MDKRPCDEWCRLNTSAQQDPTELNSLAFVSAVGNTMGNTRKHFGVVTPGRQPTLGCEGLRLQKAAQADEVSLLSYRYRGEIEVVE